MRNKNVPAQSFYAVVAKNQARKSIHIHEGDSEGKTVLFSPAVLASFIPACRFSVSSGLVVAGVDSVSSIVFR